MVAYSGDSGSSGGPHLHYEIRDTETQRLYNPVREGIIRPRDEYPPRIVRLHYVEVDTVQGVPVRSVPESYAVIRTAAGRYALDARRTRRRRPQGLFRGRSHRPPQRCLELLRGMARHSLRGRHPLLRIPHGQLHLRHIALQRCRELLPDTNQFAQRGDPPGPAGGRADSFYPTMAERGLIRTAEGQVRRIRIEAEDDCGNVSTLEFAVRGRAGEFRAEADTTAVTLRPTGLRSCASDARRRSAFPKGRFTSRSSSVPDSERPRRRIRASSCSRPPTVSSTPRRPFPRRGGHAPRQRARARCNYAPNWPYARAEARWPASEAHMPTAR